MNVEVGVEGNELSGEHEREYLQFSLFRLQL